MGAFRILVADDDIDDYEYLCEVFAELNREYDIVHVSDGEKLVNYLFGTLPNEELLPEIILLDINMPKMNGLEALEKIKSHPFLARIPVFIYTTSICQSQKHLGYELGVNGFELKGHSVKSINAFANVINDYLLQMNGLTEGDPQFIKDYSFLNKLP